MAKGSTEGGEGRGSAPEDESVKRPGEKEQCRRSFRGMAMARKEIPAAEGRSEADVRTCTDVYGRTLLC
jgi:hypothetical protein